MAAIKITFEDPSDPGNPGAERIYADDTTKVMSDHGTVPVSDVEAGWKLVRPRESWQTVHAVESL